PADDHTERAEADGRGHVEDALGNQLRGCDERRRQTSAREANNANHRAGAVRGSGVPRFDRVPVGDGGCGPRGGRRRGRADAGELPRRTPRPRLAGVALAAADGSATAEGVAELGLAIVITPSSASDTPPPNRAAAPMPAAPAPSPCSALFADPRARRAGRRSSWPPRLGPSAQRPCPWR